MVASMEEGLPHLYFLGSFVILILYFLAACRDILGSLVVSWQSLRKVKRPESHCAQPRNNQT